MRGKTQGKMHLLNEILSISPNAPIAQIYVLTGTNTTYINGIKTGMITELVQQIKKPSEGDSLIDEFLSQLG